MHIAHFCGALKGGPLSIISDWIAQQVRAGHRVTLFYSPLRDSIEEIRSMISSEVQLVAIDVRRDVHIASDIRAVFRLSDLLRRAKPDILHLHSSKAGGVGRVAARIARIPTVYSPHAVAFLRTDVGKLARAVFFGMEWLLGAAGDITVACSASEFQAMRLIPGHKTVIPNGIYLTTPPSRRRSSDRKKELNIVLCGRITTQKNPALACEIARQSPLHWRWTWLGDGEMSDIVRHAGRIAISGWMPRDEILDRLGNSDVMVHTSSWEGMPLAILEAMAQEVPVVATDIVGTRDLVVSGETGFVARTPAEFLQALEQLDGSADLRRRLGAAGRARIEREFDQSKLAVKWIALYEALLTGRRRSIASSSH